MRHLEQDDPAVWRTFLEGDLCCQKTEIPGIAIGGDHAGEQENKKMKNRGGISGLTQPDNSWTWHFPVAPVVCAISEQMLNIGGRESLVREKHHQLTNYFTERQNKNVSSLLSVLENNLSFRVEDCPQARYLPMKYTLVSQALKKQERN